MFIHLQQQNLYFYVVTEKSEFPKEQQRVQRVAELKKYLSVSRISYFLMFSQCFSR